MTKLRVLRDGDTAVSELVVFGEAAIPALRDLLFEREPSGIFEPRCRTVEALAGLRAYDVLIEYLLTPRAVIDPVEGLGDEAVLSAAARAIGGVRSEGVFDALIQVTSRRLLAGAIESLGEFRRLEALPFLIAGLAEDFTRRAAESAILQLGGAATPALLRAASTPKPSSKDESVSSLRARRSALRTVEALGPLAQELCPIIDCLMRERDPWIATIACKIMLESSDGRRRQFALDRLTDMQPTTDLLLGLEIESALNRYAPAKFKRPPMPDGRKTC